MADDPDRIRATFDRVVAWLAARGDVSAVALVGSQARGDAGPGSDIDLVVLCDDPRAYVEDDAWPAEIGGELIRTQRWGDVTERRLRIPGIEAELELGFVTRAWDPPPKLCKDAKWLLVHPERD